MYYSLKNIAKNVEIFTDKIFPVSLDINIIDY